MHIDEEYAIGIRVARNNWIIRNTRDQVLKAAVARDNQALRRQLAGEAA